ncbi:AbrB/MazE/SpoVT family DNA-binding domain-containing protein [uncultured Sphingomonas sp.]|uniref:AbrB/MazE/SpoVT family DNA-binding domain-containing protein n=1 Tax=uncultured Sphingomonas sp. TaxID=158754 RepID=UPI0025F4E952|nr:AbrB/MazE/SpoVT family DNA-binding domain-containing protein [uncultured Sphingomonas sp.]
MGNEYRAKVFKSGNSVALRLPKALGFVAGQEVCVREEAGRFSFEAMNGEGRIDLSGLWGSCPDLKPLSPEEREFERSPRVWDDPDWPGWKAGSGS